MSANVFELTDVHFAYRDTPALAGLTLAIPAGQRVVLLGANGSGKSTLLRLLDGLSFAQRGTVTAFGAPLTEERFVDDATAMAFRRRVGLVFQNPDVQLFNPTVFDELAFGPLQLGWSMAEILARVGKALESFSIAHLRNRSPHRLSGGEKKRVALAAVLVMEPEVVLLDEPTAALDPRSASEIINLLVAARHTGRTVITATHNLDIVADIADHCVVMQAGAVVASGPPARILADVDLLIRTGLTHAHLHVHADGTVHRHHRLHSHGIGHVDKD